MSNDNRSYDFKNRFLSTLVGKRFVPGVMFKLITSICGGQSEYRCWKMCPMRSLSGPCVPVFRYSFLVNNWLTFARSVADIAGRARCASLFAYHVLVMTAARSWG